MSDEHESVKILHEAFPMVPIEVIASIYIGANKDHETVSDMLERLAGSAAKACTHNGCNHGNNKKKMDPCDNDSFEPSWRDFANGGSDRFAPKDIKLAPHGLTTNHNCLNECKDFGRHPIRLRMLNTEMVPREDLLQKKHVAVVPYDDNSSSYKEIQKKEKSNKMDTVSSSSLSTTEKVNENTRVVQGSKKSKKTSKSRNFNRGKVNCTDNISDGNLTVFGKGTSCVNELDHSDRKESDTDTLGTSLLERKAVEEFLFSMFGIEMDMDIVRAIVGQYNGDMQQSLDTLLEISVPSVSDGTVYDYNLGASKGVLQEDTVLKALEEAFPHKDNEDIAFIYNEQGQDPEKTVDILLHVTGQRQGKTNILLSQVLDNKVYPSIKVEHSNDYELESQFSDSNGGKMDRTPFEWQMVTRKKCQVHGRPAKVIGSRKNGSAGSSNDYEQYRCTAKQHLLTMKHYFQEAAAAYNKGQRAWAGILSEQGKKYKEMHREANKFASHQLFQSKNDDVNTITIDLHAQHVEEGTRLVKLYLKNLSPLHAVNTLVVITGKGCQRMKLKTAIITFLHQNGIEWSELNPGCISINLKCVRAKQDLAD